jgi:hypothetical protein
MTEVLCIGPAFCPPSIPLPQKSVATFNFLAARAVVQQGMASVYVPGSPGTARMLFALLKHYCNK